MNNGVTAGKKALSRLCGMSPLIITVIVLAFFSVINAMSGIGFLSPENVSVILNQACFLMIVGIGQAIVILTGGINLSMGAVMAFTTVLWGGMLLQSSEVPAILPVVLVLMTGALIGLVNGLLITRLNIPSFIATFAMMYICRGLAWVYLKNRVLYPLDDTFRVIAMGRLFQIGGFTVTLPMFIALAALIFFFFLLRFTNMGRRIYFTGSNPTAARFSGVNTRRLLVLVYVVSSVLASFAGLMYVARLNACEPGMATKTHFEAITVSLIGGFSMAGGYGNIWGIVGGAVVVYSIQAGMNSLQLPAELQTMVNGFLIIIAVFVNRILMDKKMKIDNEISDSESAGKKRKSRQKKAPIDAA